MRTAWRTLLPVAALALAALPAGAEWLEAGTEHFRFVFEARDRAAVDELATFCEEVYDDVCGFLESWPSTIPVVVRGRVDDANGDTAPFPTRVDLYVAPLSWPWNSPKTRDLLRLILTHELTHYVQLTRARGIFHGLSRVFGRDAAWGSFIFLPGWMIEGPTTNSETIFTTGGRGRDPFFEVLYEAPAEDGALFSLAQAGYYSAFPPSGRIYVSGYVLVRCLLQRYGDDVLARILDGYLRFPFFGPWRAIHQVTGEDMGQIFEDLRLELEQSYEPRLAIRSGKLLTPAAIGDWYHPVATDRGLYVYRADLGQGPAIVRYDAAGTEEVLARGSLTDPSSFSASQDGRLVCSARLAWDFTASDGESAVSDLWMTDLADRRTRRLTTGAHLWHPALSADGSTLVAVQVSGSYSRLVAVDPSSGATSVLYSVAGATVSNPAISPDGARVAFALDVRGFQDVCVMELATAACAAVPLDDPRSPVTDVNPDLARRVLGPDAAIESFPRWDGSRRVLFSSDRSEALALYEADIDTGVVTLVQEDPVAAYEGVVQGDDLLYASYSSKGWCLKSAPILEPGARPTVANDLAADIPEPAPWRGEEVPAAPYRDLPCPYLWYPRVTLGSGSPSGIDVGIGADILAGSLLGTRSWSVGVAWHPLTAQPDFALAGSAGLGRLRLEAGFGGDYSYQPSVTTVPFLWQTQADLSAVLPLWSWSLGDRGSAAAAGARVILVTQQASAEPMTFAEVLAAPPAAAASALYAAVNGRVAWVEAGGPIDFYYRRGAIVASDALFQLPALGMASGARIEGLVDAVLPLAGHTAVRAGLKIACGTGGLDLPSEPFAQPRGLLFDLPAPGLPGRALASLDILVPIALLDQPLPFGLALTGVSAAVHAEMTADWSVAPPRFAPGSLVYLGAEITLLIGSAAGSVPLTVGLAARFDTADGWRFDEARPYVAIAFDSFGPLGLEAKPARPAGVRHALR